MVIESQIINYAVMSLLVIAYMYIIMEFVDRILEGPRLKRWHRIIIGIINTGILLAMVGLIGNSSLVLYIGAFLLLFLEFAVFYKDTMKRVYFVASACIFHIMSVRAMIVGVFAWKTEYSYFHVANSSFLAVLSLSVTLCFLSFVILAVIKLIPGEKVKIVNQHEEQLIFMLVWLTVFNIYLLINARVYTYDIHNSVILENQILMPLSVMIGLYVVLFFSFKTSELLGYQAQHDELMLDIYKEQQYREAIISEALYSYETNFSRGEILSGFESYKEALGNNIYNYEFVKNEIIHTLVHEEDLKAVLHFADVDCILSRFENGKNELTVEYRRVSGTDTFRWVKAVTHLYRDKTTSDVMGFTYVKDIHKEKESHLALQERAERDSLTGMYNKGTTEIQITSYLSRDADLRNKGALFLIDVDDFKAINDHLGHAKGDEVLCELAEKLKGVFRTEDIVGRVGGDEFLVFMKRSSDEFAIREKAKLICEKFYTSYRSSFGVEYFISASIGIATYPNHGLHFEELYKRADIALYTSKNKGKNIYSIYEGQHFAGYESNRTQIDGNENIFLKHFIDNRPGYVFETLYGAKDTAGAIESVLELLTKHYNYSRGYIFETDEDGTTTSNTFERCNDDISPEIQNLQKVPIEAVQTSTDAFYKDGKFIVKSLEHLPSLDRSVLEPQGIKSMLQFGIFEEDKLKGFVGFDDCHTERNTDDRELEELAVICNIIATFLVKYRVLERIKSMQPPS